jgi:signal transduction histidine kinase
MGLALVKRIVERVGGRVWIEPSEERGTTVRFTWPASMGTR